ncbi:MAG: hypothetical protein IAE80_17490, partial [Anaerolinea sp.]|nr:hypothetical protein [Anaerolinea sp.]
MRSLNRSELLALLLIVLVVVYTALYPAPTLSDAAEATGTSELTTTVTPSITASQTRTPTPTNTLTPPPVNDLYANATIIHALPFQTTQVYGGATQSASDPQVQCGTDPYFTRHTYHSSVWYRYAPTVDTSVLIDTIDAQMTFVFAVFTGAEGALTQVNCSKSSEPGGRHSFLAQANVTYSIMIAPNSVYPSTDTAPYPLQFSSAPLVPNDDILYAPNVTTLPTSYRQELFGATSSMSDPRVGCPSSYQRYPNTVWYRMIPTQDMSVTIEVNSPTQDVVIAILTGESWNLVPRQCADTGTRMSEAMFAGVSYYVMIGVDNQNRWNPQPPRASAVIDVTFTRSIPGDVPTEAIPLTGFPVSMDVDISGATSGRFDNRCISMIDSTGHQSLWFTYTPSETHGIVVQAWESDFPYKLSIFTGTASNPTSFECRDDSIGFTAQAGVTYYIQLITTEPLIVYPPGTMGRLRIDAPDVVNDLPSAPIIIPSDAANFEDERDISRATRSSTEDPRCGSSLTYGADRRYSVWYSWTADVTRQVVFTTEGSDYDTMLYINRSVNGHCSRYPLAIMAQAGQTYLIEVSYPSVDRLPSPSMLHLRMYNSSVPNDLTTYAQPINGFPFSFEQEVSPATVTPYADEFYVLGCGGFTNSVWYRYIADADRTIVVDTANSTYDTLIAVFKEPGGGSCLPTVLDRSRLEINARAGNTYYFMIAHDGETPLPYPSLLRVNFTEGMSNGTYANARVIPGDSVIYKNQSDLTGTPQTAGELPCIGTDHRGGLWWMFTPNSSGIVDVEFYRANDAQLVVVQADTGQSVGCSQSIYHGPPPLRYGERLVFTATRGTTYAIFGAGRSGYSASLAPSLAYLDLDFSPILRLVSPQGLITEQPTFTWEHIPGMTWYYVWVDSPDSGHVFDQWFDASQICDATTCSAQAPVTLNTVGEYEWWVQWYHPVTGYGYWSERGVFGYPTGTAVPISPTGV